MNAVERLRHQPDTVLSVTLAAIIAVEVSAFEPAEQTKALPFAIVAGLALALRRRLPLLAFLLAWLGLAGLSVFAIGFDNDSLSFVAIFLIAHYSLGRWTTGVEAGAGVVCVLASTVAFTLGDAATNDGVSNIDVGDIAFALGIVAGPWAAGLAIRLRQEREVALKSVNQRLETERNELARRAVIAERARIARDLHDVVSHAISVTVIQARGARRTLGHDEEGVRRALDAIEHTNAQALGDMRRLLAVLRDAEGDSPASPPPSLTRLDDLLDDVRRSGLDITLEDNGHGPDIPPGVDLSAYRIVQEALTNVLKHADAATVRIRLEYNADSLTLTVSDDGTLPPTDGQPPGHGLIGIRERVSVIGGEVEAGPAPGGGYIITARLPYFVESS
ncbi:sensor histidine kinase [Streptomyces sp. SID13031]|uniref:sensor histidine kinase n=1 Tax=Streptomyces sp. SID13031 TaxID=2706046 RepID=UPI0013CBDBE1|nr:sensor histidine kinase [Streptomyces sp. SID13031]NEA36921.1 sensor histidine kinase [Streptomyces sp. SID13031]